MEEKTKAMALGSKIFLTKIDKDGIHHPLKQLPYDHFVDYKFLEEMNVTVKKYQPWQLGLFHPDMKGKMVWYPVKGTLMYEDQETEILYRVKNPDILVFTDTEDVYNEISKIINEQ